MGDVHALRSTLSATDGTDPAIKSSASSMMRMYDKSPSLAVAEWRNVLQSCTDSQLLPLLYVANEVLQISKRNRGNKYLESFSPILGGSLRLICERDPSVTEKVRRTAKIWGDRRIFSARFVGELLAGVEGYRHRDGDGTRKAPSPAKHVKHNFSPQEEEIQPPPNAKGNVPSDDDDDDNSMQLEDIAHSHDDDDHDDEDDDNDDPFGNSGPSLLNVSNFTVDKHAFQRDASKSLKRPRTTPPPSSSSSKKNDGINDFNNLMLMSNSALITTTKQSKNKKAKRKSKALTTSSLVEIVDHLSQLDDESKIIARNLSSITSSDLYNSNEEVNEVGDELIDLHAKINGMMADVKKQGRNLWHVAEGKRNVEGELKKYLVWMKNGLNVDEDEIEYCNDLERKLTLLQVVHAAAKKARDEKRIKEAQEKEIAAAAAREMAEKEEAKRSLEKIQQQTSMTEARPGMVWNKQMREYQYIDTEESWRD